MRDKYHLSNPQIIVVHAVMHDGDVQVQGNPHALVVYNGHFIDFTDLTRDIQIPDSDIVWSPEIFKEMVDKGADHVLGILRVDSLYSVDAVSSLYSSILPSIKSWKPKSTSSKKRPNKFRLYRGEYDGELGLPPDTRTIKRIGFNNGIQSVHREQRG